MNLERINVYSKALHGAWAHVDPDKLIEKLSPDIAKQKINNKGHNCWELLHHTVIWQETFIKTMLGENIDWNEVESKQNWPSLESMEFEKNFFDLKERFYKNTNKIVNTLKQIDLQKKHKLGQSTPDISNHNLLLAYIIHLSYHIGQITTLLNLLKI